MDDRFSVLLAEDDSVSRMILEKALKNAGYEVVSVDNGKSALELMNEKFFPIVLTDWLMPEMDGIELCRAIRQKPRESVGYVFIILFTVKESPEDILAGLSAGADDYLTKPVNSAELIARLNTGKRILELERSLKRANEELRILSITDALTGCFNRRHLTANLPHEIKRARRYNRNLSVILCDIDRFKKVNDDYGHHVGDSVLKAFSTCIRESIRTHVDWIARYGGEEFLIVLPETDVNGASCLADRIRENLRKKEIMEQEKKIIITASFGVASFEPNTKNKAILADDLIKTADTYLYQAKRAGGNAVKAGAL